MAFVVKSNGKISPEFTDYESAERHAAFVYSTTGKAAEVIPVEERGEGQDELESIEEEIE